MEIVPDNSEVNPSLGYVRGSGDDPNRVYPGPGMIVFLLANALLCISGLRIWRANTRTSERPNVEQAR